MGAHGHHCITAWRDQHSASGFLNAVAGGEDNGRSNDCPSALSGAMLSYDEYVGESGRRIVWDERAANDGRTCIGPGPTMCDRHDARQSEARRDQQGEQGP